MCTTGATAIHIFMIRVRTYIMYKDRAAPPIGGPALHDSGVKTVQWRKRECHDSYQEVEVYLVHNIYYIYVCSLCDKY